MPRKNVRWTQNKKNILKRAFRKNLPLAQVAKLFNTTIPSVATQKSFMVRTGELKIKQEDTGYRWILDKVTDAVPKSELRKSPKYYHFRKYPEMVEKIGRRKSRKSKLVNTEKNKFNSRKWDDERIKQLIQMYQEGFDAGKTCMETEQEISKKLGIGRSVVSTRKSLATKQGYVFPKFERSKTRRVNKNVDEDNAQFMRNMEFWEGFYRDRKVRRKRNINTEKKYSQEIQSSQPLADSKINKAIETMATGFELIAEALRDILIK